MMHDRRYIAVQMPDGVIEVETYSTDGDDLDRDSAVDMACGAWSRRHGDSARTRVLNRVPAEVIDEGPIEHLFEQGIDVGPEDAEFDPDTRRYYPSYGNFRSNFTTWEEALDDVDDDIDAEEIVAELEEPDELGSLSWGFDPDREHTVDTDEIEAWHGDERTDDSTSRALQNDR